MDTNVDPASTFQVVNALIKHDKDFDLLVIPGASHTNGGAYGDHKRFDFFTRQLLRLTPPEWDAVAAPKRATTPPRGTDRGQCSSVFSIRRWSWTVSAGIASRSQMRSTAG